MVLRERGEGRGSGVPRPALSLSGQRASFSHSCSCLCRQTSSSIPLWALGQSIHSFWETGSHGPCLSLFTLAPGPWLGQLGTAPGWRLMEREEGISKVLKERKADVVCESSLHHQNTISEHFLKSPVHLWCLLPHPAPPPTSRKSARLGDRPPPQI